VIHTVRYLSIYPVEPKVTHYLITTYLSHLEFQLSPHTYSV